MENGGYDDETERKSLPKLFGSFQIHKRFVIGILCAIGVGISFISQGSIEIALEKAMNRLNLSETEKVSHCPRGPGNSTEIVYDGVIDWPPIIQKISISCYYVGFTISQIPMGMAAERHGFKWPFIGAMLASSLLNVMVPVGVNYGGSSAFIVINTFMGFAQGGLMPMLNVLVARWYPITERTTFGALLNGCTVIGHICAAILSKRNHHWSLRYYLSGIGAVFALILVFVFKSTPQSDRFISNREREFLNKNVKNVSPLSELAPTPWRSIFRSFAAWGFFAVQFGHHWFFYGVVIDMPVYFEVILRFSRPLVVIWATVPLVVFFVTLVSWALFCDHLLNEGLLGLAELRMCNTAIGTLGPGILLIFCSYSNCYYHLTVFLYILCMAVTAVYYSGATLNAIDLSPNYAGTLMGIAKTVSSLTIFGPFILELIVSRVTLLDWRHAFWVEWAIITVAFFIYCLFGSSKLQDWNTPNAEETDTEETQPESEN